MDTRRVRQVAEKLGQSISLTVDPNAEPSERFLVVVGLDGMAVGRTPQSAMRRAVADFSSRNGDQRAIRRRRVIA